MSSLWLYQIPSWALAVLVIGATLAYTLTGLLVGRVWMRRLENAENDSAGLMLSIAGVAYAVLLAMIAVGVWEQSSSVETAVQDEANALSTIYRNLEGYRPAERDRMRALVSEYVDFVVRDEWPALQRGRKSPRTELAGQNLNVQLTTFVPASEREQMLHPLVLEHNNTFAGARQIRLLLGTRGLDPITWFVVLIGGLVTVGFSFFFRTQNFRLHAVLSMLAAGMLALLIFLIVAMDHPMWGDMSVKPDALTEVLRQPVSGAPSPELTAPAPAADSAPAVAAR